MLHCAPLKHKASAEPWPTRSGRFTHARPTAALAALFALLLTGPSVSNAGLLSLKTSLEVKGEYEWNPFLLSDLEKKERDVVEESYVTRVWPVLGLKYSSDYAEVSASYGPRLAFYTPRGGRKYTTKAHQASISARLNFTDRLALSISDSFMDSVVGAGRLSDQPDLDDRYTQNTCSEVVRYAPGARIVISLGHESSGVWHRRKRYKEANRDENFAVASLGYILGGRTEAGLAGRWGLISSKTPSTADDRYEYSATVYAQRRFEGLRTRIRAEAGLVATDYKRTDELPRPKGTRGFKGGITIDRRVSENVNASLNAFAGYSPSDVLGGEYYRTIGAALSVRQTFLDRFEAILSGRFARNRYIVSPKRRDWAYNLTFVGGYRLLRWLSFRAGYTFAKIDSTIEQDEYDNHGVFASIYAEYGWPRR